jgi:uncharacterized phage protein gp47/JayE
MPDPFPLPTLACTVDANGISAPSYSDIFSSLQASYFGIYGGDADLDEDSQDGQWIAVLAKAVDDANQMAIAVYNQFSPATAVGVGLSSVIKINGLKRHSSSNSQVDIVLVGVVGTSISNGIIGDDSNLGTQWNLPSLVTIPVSGTITVIATCSAAGAVAAAPNTLTEILTPTPGLQTANNPAAATLGDPIEFDAQVRQRQSISTSKPAQAILGGIVAEVANLTGVERVAGYQNDTNVTDANGLPAHNIAIVVQGGDPIAIATAIANKKPPGIPTYGTTIETVFDSKGVPDTVSFFQLSVIEDHIYVTGTALVGYVSSTGVLAKSSLSIYSSDLNIGEEIYLNRLWAPGNLSGTAAVLAYLAANSLADTSANRAIAQAQLDTLSATFDLTTIAQARADMVIVGGPFNAGAVSIHVTNTANYSSGKAIYIVMDDGSFFKTTVASVAGVVVGINDAIPGGRSAVNGALVYVVGDVNIAFNEAAATVTTDVSWNVS